MMHVARNLGDEGECSGRAVVCVDVKKSGSFERSSDKLIIFHSIRLYVLHHVKMDLYINFIFFMMENVKRRFLYDIGCMERRYFY